MCLSSPNENFFCYGKPRMHGRMHHDHPRLVELKDNLGNECNSVNENGDRGGLHRPDPSTREIVSHYS